MPRRWLMPRENPPTRLVAAPASLGISMTRDVAVEGSPELSGCRRSLR